MLFNSLKQHLRITTSLLFALTLVSGIGFYTFSPIRAQAQGVGDPFPWSASGSQDLLFPFQADITESNNAVELYGTRYRVNNSGPLANQDIPYLRISNETGQICTKNFDSINMINQGQSQPFGQINIYGIETIGESIFVNGIVGASGNTVQTDFGNGVTLPDLVPINQPPEGQNYAVGMSFILKINSSCTAQSITFERMDTRTFDTNTQGTVIFTNYLQIKAPANSMISNATNICLAFEIQEWSRPTTGDPFLTTSMSDSIRCYNESLTQTQSMSTDPVTTSPFGGLFLQYNAGAFIGYSSNDAASIYSVRLKNFMRIGDNNILYFTGNPEQTITLDTATFNQISGSTYVVAYDFGAGGIKWTYQDNNIFYFVQDVDDQHVVLRANGSGSSSIPNAPAGQSCFLIDDSGPAPASVKDLAAVCSGYNFQLDQGRDHLYYISYPNVILYSLASDQVLNEEAVDEAYNLKLAKNPQKTMLISGTSYTNLNFGAAGTINSSRNFFAITPINPNVVAPVSCSTNTTNGDSQVDVCLDVTAGSLTIYAGDNVDNDDICTKNNITNTDVVQVNASNVADAVVTCAAVEAEAVLTSLSVTSSRQNTQTVIEDIVFEDLRGVTTSSYTVTATLSDLNGSSAQIDLGTNPDGALSDADPDAPQGGDNGKIFAVLDPSGGSIASLRPNTAILNGVTGFSLGSSSTLIDEATTATLFFTTSDVAAGRYELDGTTLKYRIPAFPEQDSYTTVMTVTIV